MQIQNKNKISAVIATQRFFSYLPYFVLSFFAIRLAELLATNSVQLQVINKAFLFDFVSLVRFLPGLYLISVIPLAFIHSRLWLTILLLLWSSILFVHGLLVQYFIVTGVPLGADIFGYSINELDQAINNNVHFSIAILLSFFISMTYLWLSILKKNKRLPSFKKSTFLLFSSLLALSITPAQSNNWLTSDLNSYNISLNKSAYFYDERLNYLI